MMRLAFMATRTLATFMAIAILLSIFARAQSRTNVTLQMPHSYNPLKTLRARQSSRTCARQFISHRSVGARWQSCI